MLLQDFHQRSVVEADPVLHQDELAVEVRERPARGAAPLHREPRRPAAVCVHHLSVRRLQFRLLHHEVLLSRDEESVKLLQLSVERLEEQPLLVGQLTLFPGLDRGITIRGRRLVLRDGLEALLQRLVAQELRRGGTRQERNICTFLGMRAAPGRSLMGESRR